MKKLTKYGFRVDSSTKDCLKYNEKVLKKFLKNKFNNKIELVSRYKGYDSEIKIKCNKHKKYSYTTPRLCLINDNVCTECMKEARRLQKINGTSSCCRINKKEWLKRSIEKHGDKYFYGKVKFETVDDPVLIYCRECKVWFYQTARNHMNGHGCKECQKKLLSKLRIKELKENNRGKVQSKIALNCIEEVSKKTGIKFQTAKTKEMKVVIKNKTYYVDAYNKRLNLIIEFNGDAFHGNPKVYSSLDIPSPYSKKTAAELYKNTILKREALRTKYNIISVWEYDWKNNKDKTLKKIIDKIKVLKKRNKEYTFSMDMGIKNTALVVLDKKHKIVHQEMIPVNIDTMVYPENRIKSQMFIEYFNDLFEKFLPKGVICERFQNRGFRGGQSIVECVSFMLGILGYMCTTFKSDLNLVTAATWKNEVNRHFNLEKIYEECKKEGLPLHKIDSLLMNLYYNNYNFEGIKKDYKKYIKQFKEKIL